MRKKEQVIRIIVNSVLLVAVIVLGVTVYQAGNERTKQQKIQQEQQQALLNEQQAEEQEEQKEESVDAGTSQVEAQQEEAQEPAAEEESQEAAEEESSAEVAPEAEAELEAPTETEVETETVSMIPEVNFTENTLMVWPLSGDVVLDYSMDATIYHPTLEVYKYSPAIAISAATGSQVLAAAAGTVTAVEEDAETGTTVTTDLGNGYQAIYGQLQDVAVTPGQTVDISTILGSVAEPTKYYSVEGSNLYFAMKKDGTPIDPITYLP